MKKKRTKQISLLSIFLIIAVYIFNNLGSDIVYNHFEKMFNNQSSINLEKDDLKTPAVTEINDKLSPSGSLKVSYIDVGQADSILIQTDNYNMLIDAGNNADGSKLVNYLKSLGITEFKYVIGTHPHEDHIGGLDDIINAFKIDSIFLPDAYTTTATFESVLDAIEQNNLEITIPQIGDKYQLGQANFEIIYSGSEEEDLNDSSIVLKLTYNNNSFLFTGDATSRVEEIILNQKKDIQVDVLKVGHHGSKYSSSNSFLKKVNPKYAIISVGKDNNYDHPNITTVNKLKKLGITIYRTDELGTIVATSDGEKITFENYQTDTNG